MLKSLLQTLRMIQPRTNWNLAHNSARVAKAADFILKIPTLTDSNFKALRPTDPQILVYKDLNLF